MANWNEWTIVATGDPEQLEVFKEEVESLFVPGVDGEKYLKHPDRDVEGAWFDSGYHGIVADAAKVVISAVSKWNPPLSLAGILSEKYPDLRLVIHANEQTNFVYECWIFEDGDASLDEFAISELQYDEEGDYDDDPDFSLAHMVYVKNGELYRPDDWHQCDWERVRFWLGQEILAELGMPEPPVEKRPLSPK